MCQANGTLPTHLVWVFAVPLHWGMRFVSAVEERSMRFVSGIPFRTNKRLPLIVDCRTPIRYDTHFGSKFMLEINPLVEKLKDLESRATEMRGYL